MSSVIYYTFPSGLTPKSSPASHFPHSSSYLFQTNLIQFDGPSLNIKEIKKYITMRMNEGNAIFLNQNGGFIVNEEIGIWNR
jgi:hypothetical protein